MTDQMFVGADHMLSGFEGSGNKFICGMQTADGFRDQFNIRIVQDLVVVGGNNMLKSQWHPDIQDAFDVQTAVAVPDGLVGAGPYGSEAQNCYIHKKN